jgi:D-alanyl-D-alanine carboxypeptidase
MWSMQEVRVGKQRLTSHNALLKSFDGADGIKTGFICDSGFNVVSSATRDGRRLIAVVLGEPSGKDRNVIAAALLDHGFETAAWKSQLGAPTLDTLPVDRTALPVRSVRSSVVAWNCGNRPVARRAVKRKKPAAAARKDKGGKAAQAAKSRPAPTATASTAEKSPAPKP